MNITDLYEFLLEENLELQLIGEISCDDESIKWEYDGLGKTDEDMECHLMDTSEQDKEIINDFLIDNDVLKYFHILEPEINDSIIIFSIIEE